MKLLVGWKKAGIHERSWIIVYDGPSMMTWCGPTSKSPWQGPCDVMGFVKMAQNACERDRSHISISIPKCLRKCVFEHAKWAILLFSCANGPFYKEKNHKWTILAAVWSLKMWPIWDISEYGISFTAIFESFFQRTLIKDKRIVRNGPVRQPSVNFIAGQKNSKNVTSNRKLTRQNSVSITDFLSRVDEQVFRAMKKIASVFYELGQFSNWYFQLSLWLADFEKAAIWIPL